MDTSRKHANAALAMLVILQAIMLGSLFAGVPPHPPAATPLFGIGPFIGTSIGVAVAAMIVGSVESVSGRALTIIACLLALVSFGPQKYLDAQFGLIWPAVFAAQVAVISLAAAVYKSTRAHGEP